MTEEALNEIQIPMKSASSEHWLPLVFWKEHQASRNVWSPTAYATQMIRQKLNSMN